MASAPAPATTVSAAAAWMSQPVGLSGQQLASGQRLESVGQRNSFPGQPRMESLTGALLTHTTVCNSTADNLPARTDTYIKFAVGIEFEYAYVVAFTWQHRAL
jgi:hypothetical protein